MNDRVMEKFKEIAKDAMNCEKVALGEYQIPKDLLDDWNAVIGMDIMDYISIHNPADSDALEIQMVRMISAAL